MKKILSLLLVVSTVISMDQVTGQSLSIDTIFSLAGSFNRSKIHIGTDTIIDYKESKGNREINAINTRTIEKVIIHHIKYYKITTQNIPAIGENITTTSALLDYNDLHLINMQLKALTDSGYVEFSNQHFTGWSQLPKEKRKVIDFLFDGFPLLAEANTPFLMGLLSINENKTIMLPFFTLFLNTVTWKPYTIVGKESISVSGKQYPCWKIDAGKKGPPGYTSFHWYECKTGRMIKAELVKEGSDLKFVSELKKYPK